MQHTIIFVWIVFSSLLIHGQSNDSIFCNNNILVGAQRFELYVPILDGKTVGFVGNQSSLVANTHTIDTLLSQDIKLVKIFSPEHGFRGKADAGEKVSSEIDKKTGLPIVSLYGSNKKPTGSDLKGIDIIIFDIQEVGARFYTYVSTLHLVMEACAENNVQLIVLDRPNPNGFYVDGPILNPKYKSFVGMHPVPIVHGMSIGEYAKMINGEKWLANNVVCDLKVIPCLDWDHSKYYQLPIKPSPNLPNMLSVYLYPSLCLFEGTVVSVGRGTDWPFQIAGHPEFKSGDFTFIPKSTEGAKNPKLNGQKCQGINFTESGLSVLQNQNQIQLSWFINFYEELNLKDQFFLSNNFINLLSGNSTFKSMVIAGKTEAEIRASWEPELTIFKAQRKKYLLYSDFN